MLCFDSPPARLRCSYIYHDDTLITRFSPDFDSRYTGPLIGLLMLMPSETGTAFPSQRVSTCRLGNPIGKP